MATSSLSLLTIIALETMLLISVISDSLNSTKSIISKNNLGYYPPAEPNYPPINPFPPSAKLPASSRSWFESDDLKTPTNPNHGKTYGDKLRIQVSSVLHPDNFNGNNGTDSESRDISNPARYYLNGAHFEKIKTPSCRLTSCHGPYPNDGSLLINKEKSASNEECKQIFVQMNGCVAHRGYPIGMVCTVCCQCTKQFISEMSHSRGFLEKTDWLTTERFAFI